MPRLRPGAAADARVETSRGRRGRQFSAGPNSVGGGPKPLPWAGFSEICSPQADLPHRPHRYRNGLILPASKIQVCPSVILAGDNEVLKLGIADEHKAFCRDQRLQPGTGIGPGIRPRRRNPTRQKSSKSPQQRSGISRRKDKSSPRVRRQLCPPFPPSYDRGAPTGTLGSMMRSGVADGDALLACQYCAPSYRKADRAADNSLIFPDGREIVRAGVRERRNPLFRLLFSQIPEMPAGNAAAANSDWILANRQFGSRHDGIKFAK